MPRDDDKSLGDEATLQGGKPTPADERSLGDRSTFGGGEGSSLSDLGEFADLPDHDMEIVDLSSRYKIVESLELERNGSLKTIQIPPISFSS